MNSFFSAFWELTVDLFWTNAQTTMPIMLSIVAIVISITTAKKQNKIALFELRYRCYSQLRTIRSFDASIHDCQDAKVILIMFDALWGANVATVSGNEGLILARCHMEKIVHDVLHHNFLFRHKFQTDFGEILMNTQKILIAATGGEVDMNAHKELHRLCELFEKKDLSYMCNKLKI